MIKGNKATGDGDGIWCFGGRTGSVIKMDTPTSENADDNYISKDSNGCTLLVTNTSA